MRQTERHHVGGFLLLLLPFPVDALGMRGAAGPTVALLTGTEFHLFPCSLCLTFAGPIFGRAFSRGAALQPRREGLRGGRECAHRVRVPSRLGGGERAVPSAPGDPPLPLRVPWAAGGLCPCRVPGVCQVSGDAAPPEPHGAGDQTTAAAGAGQRLQWPRAWRCPCLLPAERGQESRPGQPGEPLQGEGHR